MRARIENLCKKALEEESKKCDSEGLNMATRSDTDVGKVENTETFNIDVIFRIPYVTASSSLIRFQFHSKST